jgi:tetratricopeptide (TPR) repeat protein
VAQKLIGALALLLVAPTTWGQPSPSILTQQQPDSRTVLGITNEYLVAGAEAIRARQYDDGIRLTQLGLERPSSLQDRAAALSNLCAAYAAKSQPDLAIPHCTESITISASWHAFSNRSYAYYLKGLYALADADLEIAVGLNPAARQVAQIRGMLNERTLRPSVTLEEHQ